MPVVADDAPDNHKDHQNGQCPHCPMNDQLQDLNQWFIFAGSFHSAFPVKNSEDKRQWRDRMFSAGAGACDLQRSGRIRDLILEV